MTTTLGPVSNSSRGSDADRPIRRGVEAHSQPAEPHFKSDFLESFPYPQIPNLKSYSLSLFFAKHHSQPRTSPAMHLAAVAPVSWAFAALVSGHPGQDHNDDALLRRTFLQHNPRDLTHCAAKLKARGWEDRSVQRRTDCFATFAKQGALLGKSIRAPLRKTLRLFLLMFVQAVTRPVSCPPPMSPMNLTRRILPRPPSSQATSRVS